MPAFDARDQLEGESEAARAEVDATVERFKEDLVDLTYVLAKGEQLDATSRRHVLDAGAFLRRRPLRLRLFRVLGLVGGLLLGGGIGNVPPLLATTTPSRTFVALTLVLATAGGVCTTAHVMRDR